RRRLRDQPDLWRPLLHLRRLPPLRLLPLRGLRRRLRLPLRLPLRLLTWIGFTHWEDYNVYANGNCGTARRTGLSRPGTHPRARTRQRRQENDLRTDSRPGRRPDRNQRQENHIDRDDAYLRDAATQRRRGLQVRPESDLRR